MLLTFNLLDYFHLSHFFAVHLHDALDYLFVLLFEVRLIWIDPLSVSHDQVGVVRVEAVVGAQIGHACSQTYALLLLEILHLIFPFVLFILQI